MVPLQVGWHSFQANMDFSINISVWAQQDWKYPTRGLVLQLGGVAHAASLDYREEGP